MTSLVKRKWHQITLTWSIPALLFCPTVEADPAALEPEAAAIMQTAIITGRKQVRNAAQQFPYGWPAVCCALACLAAFLPSPPRLCLPRLCLLATP